jgi:hypothetical protein
MRRCGLFKLSVSASALVTRSDEDPGTSKAGKRLRENDAGASQLDWPRWSFRELVLVNINMSAACSPLTIALGGVKFPQRSYAMRLLRLYSGDNQQSHLEELKMPFTPGQFAERTPLQPAALKLGWATVLCIASGPEKESWRRT